MLCEGNIMKRKILYLSMCAPFPDTRHAGGKTFNYYIESFAGDHENEVTLVSKILTDEMGQESKINKKIKKYLLFKPSGMSKYWYYMRSINSKYNPRYRYGNVLLKATYDQYRNVLATLKKQGYVPDVIILEWTSMLLYIDEVKKYYPNAVYVASEHDVSFLGAYRKYETEHNAVKKLYKKTNYKNIKKRELSAIRKCDYVVTHNSKDRDLLLKERIPENLVGTIVPYFDAFNLKRRPDKRDILFYGAMNRVENSESALWFIEHVMPLLQEYPVRFVIVGNKPPEELKKLADDRIVVTGFVEDAAPYFESAMCAAVPLLHGAGVKVKVIEALSAGIPVLTNEIGIEGIPARNGEEFFLCRKPEEYANIIIRMLNDYTQFEDVSRKAKQLIEREYNLEESFCNYSRHIYELIQRKHE